MKYNEEILDARNKNGVKVEKCIGCTIGTETFLGFSIIQGEHVVYKFAGVRSMLGNDRDIMTYYLYKSSEEKEAKFAYKYIISALEKEYHLMIFPNYDDEMETYVASCRIGEHYFDILYDCEYGSVYIKEKYVKEVDDGFVENLVVQLLLDLLERVKRIG